MSYIIMGRDECGDEFRPDYAAFFSEADAYSKLGEARERYPEARSLWVELLKDKAYYSEIHNDRYYDDEYDLY